MTTELCGSKMLGDYSFKQIATPPKTPKKTFLGTLTTEKERKEFKWKKSHKSNIR